MNYKLDVTKDVLEFIQELDPKRFKQVLNKTLSLLENPHPHDSKKLVGYEEYFRADIGEYRIIYRVDDDTVRIALIGKRNDDEVYKKFERKTK
jgi:mRNA interferase RelE/StbE